MGVIDSGDIDHRARLDQLLGVLEEIVVEVRELDSKCTDIRRREGNAIRDVLRARYEVPEVLRHHIAEHDAEAAANGGLAFSVGIVREADPRTEVLRVVVVRARARPERSHREQAIHAEGIRIVQSGVGSAVFPVCREVRVEVVAHPQVHRQVGGDPPVVLRKNAELIHPAAVQSRAERGGHLAGLVRQHGAEAGIEEIGDLRVVARADGAVIVRRRTSESGVPTRRAYFSPICHSGPPEWLISPLGPLQPRLV